MWIATKTCGSEGVSDDDLDNEATICVNGYYEHVEEITYEGPDGVSWICRRCGCDVWEPATEDEE